MKKLLATLSLAACAAFTASAVTINLANVTADRTLNNGDVIYGQLARNVKISIAQNATVTISNAVINGSYVNSESCKWAGLTCNGNATIIIKGENNVIQAFQEYYPGIFIPQQYTLTIQGSDTARLVASSVGECFGAGIGGGANFLGTSTLNLGGGNIAIEGGYIDARGTGQGAGIGSGYMSSCGNITISGGKIQAYGGDDSSGIGSSYYGFCGDIVIQGGDIDSYGGTFGSGIGSGSNGFCGNISILGGTIDAYGNGLNFSGAGIGSGANGSCGMIAISGGSVDASASGDSGNAGTGIGSGTKGNCGGVLISGGHVEAWSGSTWVAPIGASNNGSCGPVIVGEDMIDESIGRKRTIKSGVVNLADITENTVIEDGIIITGTLAANVKISIADGATVTLRDVTINGVGSGAGITCDGDATIILEGANTVRASVTIPGFPGIYVPEGNRLTIGGDGSLTAYGNMYGAGIGGGSYGACGNIVIESGTVEAAGGALAAGIGGGYNNACGDITIMRGVTSVTATKGTSATDSIGASYGGSCGTVTVGGVVGEISQTPYTYYGTGGGTGGVTELPAPAFAADGKAATTEFVKGENGKWTLTTFAEMSNDALGKDVANGQIKVYAAPTVEGLNNASPMTSGVTVKGKKSAVMTTIEVTPPGNPPTQFFKVKFGE